MKAASDRDALVLKVRALFAKTTSNGATEHEMLAAIAKARQIMDAHEISDGELCSPCDEPIESRAYAKSRNELRLTLSIGVARFCECRTWINRSYQWKWKKRKLLSDIERVLVEEIVFFGQRSDVIFADWLLDSLECFVKRSTAAFMSSEKRLEDRRSTDLRRRSFQHGCAERIVEKLLQFAPKSESMEDPGSENALVASKRGRIDAELEKLGLKMRNTRGRRIHINPDALNAGSAAGDAACFSRPVDGEAGRRLLESTP